MQRDGYFVHPIYAFNFSGQPLEHGTVVGYVGQDANTVFGLNSHSGILGTGIQKDVSVGATWNVAPNDLSRHSAQIKVAQHLDSYVVNGTPYSDVIALSGVYTDLTSRVYGTTDTSYYRETASGTLYFAKGVGFISATFDSYELLDYEVDRGFYYHYNHKTVTGTVFKKS